MVAAGSESRVHLKWTKTRCVRRVTEFPSVAAQRPRVPSSASRACPFSHAIRVLAALIRLSEVCQYIAVACTVLFTGGGHSDALILPRLLIARHHLNGNPQPFRRAPFTPCTNPSISGVILLVSKTRLLEKGEYPQSRLARAGTNCRESVRHRASVLHRPVHALHRYHIPRQTDDALSELSLVSVRTITWGPRWKLKPRLAALALTVT